ncbi:Aldehyde/histidinol dehydrogenase [Bipolaris maydis]|uniref:Aldehyde/histidinol dehydrogenase n=1 Tax=Cochliobolus heterostrophus TaxID=5016 RepID=UPI0024DBB11F|nr:Aldehyde/histidinol dehydrogenase [Bipolaris maydis]
MVSPETATQNGNTKTEFDFTAIHRELNESFASGKTKSIKWRKWQLKQPWWMIEDNEREIQEALTSDLGRHEMENWTTDFMGLKMDILHHINNVEKWVETTPVPGSGIVGWIGRARIRGEPRGVSCIRLVTGGPEETTRFLERKFDYIFFTGSTKIARFIAAAAAKHLTPTTLELGGQCPAFVTKTADIELSAKRIALVKFTNAGQICLTANHVLVDPAVHDAFVARLEHWTREFAATGHMCRIINKRNHDRLTSLLDKSSGTIIRCGEAPAVDCRMAPVIVTNVKPTDAIMSEELFGPICPVIPCTIDDAIAVTNSLPKPLALYIFSSDKNETDYIQDRTLSGGVTINDTLFPAGVPNAPFGGVGESGMGAFHGEYGFQSFTHLRIVTMPPTWLDRFMGFRYLPFNAKNKGMVAVSNKGRSRRGETLQDQKIASAWLASYYGYPDMYQRVLSYARMRFLG